MDNIFVQSCKNNEMDYLNSDASSGNWAAGILFPDTSLLWEKKKSQKKILRQEYCHIPTTKKTAMSWSEKEHYW